MAQPPGIVFLLQPDQAQQQTDDMEQPFAAAFELRRVVTSVSGC